MKSRTTTLARRPLAIALTGTFFLAACADQPMIPRALQYAKTPEPTSAPPSADNAGLQVKVMPPAPLENAPTHSLQAPPAPNTSEAATISLGFEQLPLPTFIQTVYGSILKKNFSMDPAVASRQDLVTLRTSTPQTPTQVAETVRMLLKGYGVAVSDLGGFLRITPDNAQAGYIPELRRGRSLPDVPLAMRPIFQMVDINTIPQREAASMLKQMFGSRVNVQEDPSRNALLLTGQTDDIGAALELIRIIDQPFMAGQQSVRITPTFWGVDELTKRLGDILNTEGYSVGVLGPNGQFNVSIRYPIMLMPIGPINSIIIFGRDRTTLEHIVKWADELDQPSVNKNSGFFTYQVRHSDAQQLAGILEKLTESGSGDGKSIKATKVVVNPATNSLIFEGGAGDYSQYFSLLRDLDKPTKSALIEVTVAQIDLTSAQQMGIQWGLAPKLINGSQFTYTAGVNGINVAGTTTNTTTSSSSASSSTTSTGTTSSDSGVGGGLVLQLLDAARTVRAQISALASQTKAKVLSTPSIMARNGESATIQVGQDVPILSSSQSNANTGGALLQTVQYRNTGVILTVRPVIHSSGRIDLDVNQEVSNVVSGQTGAGANPVFSSRKVQTRLSLRDGSTVMLAGLMQDNSGDSDSGVPVLKDIPVLGSLFKTRSTSEAKTELVVLITPYVINDDFEAESITDAFRNQLGPWAQTVGTQIDAKGAKVLSAPTMPPVSAVEPTSVAPAAASGGVTPGNQASAVASDTVSAKGWRMPEPPATPPSQMPAQPTLPPTGAYTLPPPLPAPANGAPATTGNTTQNATTPAAVNNEANPDPAELMREVQALQSKQAAKPGK